MVRYGLTALGESYIWLRKNVDLKSIYKTADADTIITLLQHKLPFELALELSKDDFKELAFQLSPVQPC